MSQFAFQVVDQVQIGSTNVTHTYCVRATGGPVSVTLVWADYPSQVSAAINLVNDLDLTVQATGLAGYTLYGNGQPDHLNNAEQVILAIYYMSKNRVNNNLGSRIQIFVKQNKTLKPNLSIITISLASNQKSCRLLKQNLKPEP